MRYTYSDVDRDSDLDTRGVTMPTILNKLAMKNLSQTYSNQIERKKKMWNKDMYVHEFISGYRTEDIPLCKCGF